jgi:hypothetical protein
VAKLNNLRKDCPSNVDEIIVLERELNQILDSELVAKVRSMKLFSRLNSEKPTPLFLSLAKSSNSGKSLSCIMRPDGTPYDSDVDRNEGIVSFYENIYRKEDETSIDFSNCIERFLGERVLNNPIVKNSKLSQAERDILDEPLTVDELDSSMEKCNVRSAPGIDGLNNYFIKKFWYLLRIPLLNYLLHCFETGTLTTNFRSASIKLIPKKGELSCIKTGVPSAYYRISIK